MTSDLDIYRSANLLVKQHREDAPIHAAMRADAMLEAGDLDGYGVWRRTSGHGQLTKIRLSDGCGGKTIQRQRNLSMIAMDLEAIWEMSVEAAG